jgi:hypothetical protein
MVCILCRTLEGQSPFARAHERLAQSGSTERIAGQSKREAVWITTYTCTECRVNWQHIDAAGDPNAGWHVVH